MKAFLFELEFMWGYQTRIAGMSKTAPSFRFPPLTTVLGALASSYARRNGYGESRSYDTISELAAGTLALTYMPLNTEAISFQDINRILAIRTSGGKEYPSIENPYGSFDAPATGKTSLSYVGEGKGTPSMRVIIVAKDSLGIQADDIWGIYRIGSKESLACVTKVASCVPSVIKGTLRTSYLFPKAEGVQVLDHEGELYEESYVPVPYVGVNSKGSSSSGGTKEKYPVGLPDSVTSLVIGSSTIPHAMALPRDPNGRAYAELSLSRPYVGYSCGDETVVGIEDSY